MKKKAVIFISGGGSNMEMLIKATQNPDYPVECVAVISDRKDAAGLEKAQRLGVATHCLERRDFADKAAHEDAMLDVLATYRPDILCLAGFMRLISARLIAPYEGRILNIHPALLPLFPGLHTHQRAIDAGMKIAGCTVHLVTEGMDEGPILAQAAVPINQEDTAESLAARVLKMEHQLYPEALKHFALTASGNKAEVDLDQSILCCP